MQSLRSTSRAVRRTLYRKSPFLVGAFFAVATVAAAQLALIHRANADLLGYAKYLLDSAERVAAASVDGLGRAALVRALPCSDSDLNELRYIAFNSRYIKDIGRFEAGRVVCSAIWGRLPTPVALTASPRVVRGYSLLSDVVAPGDARIRVDMASYGNAIVTTAPAALDRVALPMAEVRALMATRDGDHKFYAFGESGHAPLSPGGMAAQVGSYLRKKICSENFDICITAESRSSGLLSQPRWTLIFVSVLALTGGMGVSASMKLSQSQKCELDRMLTRAIRHGEIDLVYQPLRRLSDLRIVGVEALARWRTYDGADVPPDIFVPMAERLGLGAELARLVITRCFGEIGSQLKPNGAYASINLSAQDVLDPSIHQFLCQQADIHGVASENVVLELTERTSADQNDLVAALSDLKSKGYRVYLDDFGTGYSNFAYLADLPLAGLKMDSRFTKAVDTNSPASHAVEAICVMAVALSLPLVAEGVETAQQASAVRKLAPKAIGQGWYLGRPCKAADIPWGSAEALTDDRLEDDENYNMRVRVRNV